MSNKTLIVGDIHIGKGLSQGKPAVEGSINSRITDQVRCLNWILDTSINRGVDRIIITGDIFEELKPDSNMVVIFMEWLKECIDYGKKIYIIAGNHDLKRIGGRYSSILNVIESAELDNVFIYNEVYTLHTEGVSFTLVPFRDRRALGCETVDEAISKITSWLPFELAGIPVCNDRVLVGHLAIDKAFWTDEVDDVSNELMMPTNVFEGYDYVWMGHVHKPQVLKHKKPYVAHIGSMDISDFGETDQQKIVVLYDPDTPRKFEQLVVPTRPLRRIRLDIPKKENTTDFLIKAIDNMTTVTSFEDAIVKLEIKLLDPEATDINREKIIKKLFDLGAYHISHFSESKTVLVVPDDKKHISDSAIEPKAAIKSYADTLEFEEDDHKSEFVTACLEVIDIAQQQEK
jgi:exonuclease SbcD